MYKHQIKFRVLYSDTDKMGYMYYGQYAKYLEMGRVETILWNGPMGVFESKAFENGTREIAIHLVSCVASGAKVIVGGGDTAAALEKFGLMKDMTHVSTGGGASLELLSGNALPAVNALEK